MANGFRTAFDIARELYEGPLEPQPELFRQKKGQEGVTAPTPGALHAR